MTPTQREATTGVLSFAATAVVSDTVAQPATPAPTTSAPHGVPRREGGFTRALLWCYAGRVG